MGTRIVPLAVASAAALYAASLFAEGPAAAVPAGNLLAQVQWLRLEVVGGRIAIRSERCPHSQHVVEATPAEGTRQMLSLESRARKLILRYEEHTPDACVVLVIDERGKLTISRTASDAAASEVQYVQPAIGAVTLTIRGKTSQKIAATDLWQLLIVERERCSEQLLPILHQLRSDWALSEQLDGVEAELVAHRGADVLARNAECRRLVEELASRSFAERQAADRSLRAGGQAVLATLRQLDQGELDGEQRRRVRAILADLADSSPDSPERVAEWLGSDKRAWLALLSRGELAQRVAATEQLSGLCRRPLAFDPQASPEQRKAQLAELMAKLAEK